VGPLLLRTVAGNARFADFSANPSRANHFLLLPAVVDWRLPCHQQKEGAMPEPNRDDLLLHIESLERANRRWKRLALGLLAMFVLVVAGIGAFGVYQHARATAARRQAEQAWRQAEAEREKAEENFQRARQAAEEALQRLEQ
jgi:hypothetical protein